MFPEVWMIFPREVALGKELGEIGEEVIPCEWVLWLRAEVFKY